jgi:hypothetical protein
MDRKQLIDFEYEGKQYRILHPTQEQLMKIDLEHRRAFAEAIRCNLLAEYEAKKMFEEKGIWGEEQEAEIRDLQVEVATNEMQLGKTDDEKEGRKIAIKLVEIRSKLLTLVNEKSKLSAQTAEGYASEAKNVLFAALCTVDDNCKPVFGDVEAFMQHADHEFTARCFGYALLADVGLKEEDTNIQFTENKWLVTHGYMEEKTSEFTKKYYAEHIGEATGIDLNAPPEQEEKPAEQEEKPKRKRGRPRKVKKE